MIRTSARWSIVVAALATVFAARALAADDFEARQYKDAAGKTLPYRLLKPRDYDPAKKYPLVLFLHGAGERGIDNAAQLKHVVTIFARPENREKFPCFVIAPQCPADQRWVEMDWGAASGTQPVEPSGAMRLTLALLGDLQKEFSIDSKRLYVGGLSMGGYGTWDIICRNQKMFAAGVAICGGGDESKVAPMAKVPIWAFHSADDPVVKVARTRNMIAAMKAAGGNPKYTEYTGLGHNSWEKAFAEPELLPWLFAQKLD